MPSEKDVLPRTAEAQLTLAVMLALVLLPTAIFIGCDQKPTGPAPARVRPAHPEDRYEFVPIERAAVKPAAKAPRRIARKKELYPYGSKLLRASHQQDGVYGRLSGAKILSIAKEKGVEKDFAGCAALEDGLRCPCADDEACSDDPRHQPAKLQALEQ